MDNQNIKIRFIHFFILENFQGFSEVSKDLMTVLDQIQQELRPYLSFV